MISFKFIPLDRLHSDNKKQEAIDLFIDYIGPFKEDFDERNIVATVNMDAGVFKDMYSWNSLSDNYIDLHHKVQEYRKSNPFTATSSPK